MARRLNLRTEVNDFTFEGPLDALQLGQVDAAIAAIDITPKRAALVDFSTPYYMGEDGYPGRGRLIAQRCEIAGRPAGSPHRRASGFRIRELASKPYLESYMRANELFDRMDEIVLTGAASSAVILSSGAAAVGPLSFPNHRLKVLQGR